VTGKCFQHNAERLLRLIERVYRWLPLGTIVNNKVLVVHGGISDVTDLDWVRNLDRYKVSTCTFCVVSTESTIHDEKYFLKLHLEWLTPFTHAATSLFCVYVGLYYNGVLILL
jgi:hypothetical protein